MNKPENKIIRNSLLFLGIFAIMISRNFWLYATNKKEYIFISILFEIAVISTTIQYYSKFVVRTSKFLLTFTLPSNCKKINLILLLFVGLTVKLLLTISSSGIIIKSPTLLYASTVSFLYVLIRSLAVSAYNPNRELTPKHLIISGEKLFRNNSPVVALMVNDLLFLIRQKLRTIFALFLKTVLFISIFLLFIFNNDLYIYASFVCLLPSFLISAEYFNFDDDRNLLLFKHNRISPRKIFTAELLELTILNIVLFLFTVIALAFIPKLFNFLILLSSFAIGQIVSTYIVFIKRAFYKNEFEKNLVAIVSFVVPLTIPYVIFQGVKRLND